MNSEKKTAFGLMLHEMINADGKVDNSEIKYFNIIYNAIGLKQAVDELKK